MTLRDLKEVIECLDEDDVVLDVPIYHRSEFEDGSFSYERIEDIVVRDDINALVME